MHGGILTKPKIGSIIRYPYWGANNKWFVLKHGGVSEDDNTIYVDVICIGKEYRETLVAYIGEDKLDSLHPTASAYWEYVS